MTIDSSVLIYIHLLFLLLLLHYLFFLQRILSGLNKLKKSNSDKIQDEMISIIIPFRNEEENILANLKSIESLRYPIEKFEVIYADDFSEDISLKILSNNITNNNIRVISVPKDYSTNAHKKRAIRYGIENAKGDIIVTTDADCIYEDEWLHFLMQSFDADTGFVSGPVEFISDGRLFSEFQKLEFAGLVLTGAGLIGSDHPTICNAANIAYRKNVFNEVGGYKDNMNLSSGDDELLMQKISKDTEFKVKFCIDKKAIVKTSANKTVENFIQQRKRWASKGLFYADKSLVLKLIVIYTFYLGLILQLILGLIANITFLFPFMISLVLKFAFEFRILHKGKDKLFPNLNLKYFIPVEFIQIPYIIYAGLIGTFGNYFWKSRKIKR